MTLVEAQDHSSPASTDVAVAVTGLTKRFRMPGERHSSVRDHLLRPRAHGRAEMLTALRDVSFGIDRGSSVGIVGRNGSGKSTLLRCMAGIYLPDAGEVQIRGRLAAFIELGIGFDRELTARDNVITSGMLFGLSARDLRARFGEIMAYAGLEEFSEVKLKNYSSGMAMRLAFALTTHVDADVLLFDEAIATGDLEFQQRSLERFAQLRSEGRTLVLVSHDMHAVQTLCDRAFVLERGRIVFEGDGAAVAEQYDSINLGDDPDADAWRDTRRRQRSMDGHGEAAARPERSANRVPGEMPLRDVAASDHRHTLRIAARFALVEYKLKYTDAVLGYAWAVMRPLAIFAVLYLVFTRVAHLDRGVPHYAVYLLTALVLWTAFLDATTNAAFSLVGRAELLRKAQVPRAAVPLSVVLRAHMDLLMNLLVVVLFLALAGIAPRASWLQMPVLFLGVAALGAGLALLLSALYVRLRDVDQLWAVLAQILFFGSAILYVVSAMPPGLRRPLVLFNPLATIFTQIRHALIDPHAPSAAALAGGTIYLLVPVAVTGAIIVLGAAVFARIAPSAAEYL
jgi:ABC-type polysaccharide/polyol phosphate transport system ATPase subunit/ABC-type polysaccharide/polyol phosphate export permease